MGFVEQLEKQRSVVYYIHSTPDDGEPSWFFLKLDVGKQSAFDQAMSGTETFDLKHFGQVLHSGYGANASDKLKVQMKRKYGVEYDD